MRLPPVVQIPAVARLLSASVLMTLAVTAQSVALGWLVYDITGEKLDLGLLGLAEFAPAAALTLVSGHVADRHHRARIMAGALAAEAVIAVAMAVYASTRPTSAGPVFALAIAFGCARAFAAPAGRALLPSVAPAEHLSSAVALGSASWQFASIFGPALGGLAYAAGPQFVFGGAAALFVTAGVLYLSVPYRPERVARSTEGTPTLRSAIEGLQLIRRDPILLGAISLDLFAVLFGGAVALLPVLAKDILHTGPLGLGILRAAGAVGATLTGLYLAWRPLRQGVGRALFVAVGAFGVGTIVLGLSRSYAISLLAVALLNGADMVSVFVRSTLVPLVTPDELRGRVMAVENVFIGASNELGAFESGVAAATLGTVPAIVLGGTMTLAVVAVWPRLFPALARVNRFDDVAHRAGPGRSPASPSPAERSGAAAADVEPGASDPLSPSSR